MLIRGCRCKGDSDIQKLIGQSLSFRVPLEKEMQNVSVQEECQLYSLWTVEFYTFYYFVFLIILIVKIKTELIFYFGVP